MYLAVKPQIRMAVWSWTKRVISTVRLETAPAAVGASCLR